MNYLNKEVWSYPILDGLLCGTVDNKSTFERYLQKILEVLNMSVEELLLYHSESDKPVTAAVASQNVNFEDEQNEERIIATEIALKDLEKQAEQSAVALQKISETGTKFQEVGGKIEGVGKTLLLESAAVTGIGVAGLKVATALSAMSMSGIKDPRQVLLLGQCRQIWRSHQRQLRQQWKK